MTRLTLTDQIDSIAWSEEALDLFAVLAGFSASDENGAIVIVAAAAILAREHPETSKASSAALLTLTEEFGDLVFNVRGRLTSTRRMPLPKLSVVGGTDVH